MLLTNLCEVLDGKERIWLWYCGEVRYRGRFSAIPDVFLHYPVDLIKPVDNELRIYLM